MHSLLLATMLALGAPVEVSTPACVPVQVEAPLPLPRSDRSGPGCIAYQRTTRAGHGDALRVLVFGDPQVKSARDVDYFRRDIVAPLIGTHDASLGITLGDLVDDQPALLPSVKAVTAELGVPWLHAPGNHDVDPDATSDADSLGAFHRAIGPDTFARQTALANLAVLDDVIAMPGRKPAYIGGLREDQFAFLAAYLPEIENHLHYRSVDVSSVKELVRRWYPGLLATRVQKAGSHRALDDILESIDELRHYREHVFTPRAD